MKPETELEYLLEEIKNLPDNTILTKEVFVKVYRKSLIQQAEDNPLPSFLQDDN